MTIYKITQTETFFGNADSLDDAQELFNEGVFDCATSLTVDISEADFENPISQLETAKSKIEICLACGYDKNEGGYHAPDDVTITFRTLKQAQNEAILQGINFAMDYLEDVNYHTGAYLVAELLDIINGTQTAPEWQSTFFTKPEHTLYSTSCEN